MSQFPGFDSPGISGGDVGMTDADEDSSSSVSRAAEHFGSSLRISPPPLSIPNSTANYFAVTAAYFPSQFPPNFPSTSIADKKEGSGPGSSSTNASVAQPSTPSLPIRPPVTNSAPINNFTAPPLSPEVSKPKAQPRNKVPLEKGYSQMVWLKTMQTETDIAGLKGQSRRRLISMDEIKKHKSPEEAWTVLRNRVYNISPYLKFHPGGEDMLMKAAGKDCTALFNKYHAWVNAEFLLEHCMVGLLDVQHQ